MENQNVVKHGKITPKGLYGKITLDVFNTILDLKTDGRCAIKGIVNLLHSSTIDHREVLGEQKYRYKFRCSQNKLANLVGMDISHFSKGIKQLIDANLVIKDDGIIYINPLVFNAMKILDKRTLDKFGIEYKE